MFSRKCTCHPGVQQLTSTGQHKPIPFLNLYGTKSLSYSAGSVGRARRAGTTGRQKVEGLVGGATIQAGHAR